MHDIWNPWHGCTKVSEGCQNCYMYYLDSMRSGIDSRKCFRTNSFRYPVEKERSGEYRIKSGEQIRVCMTSDFFLEEADPWRDEAWALIRERSDVIFFLLTKRPERVASHLPSAWGEGWENVFFNVTCENQRRADERIPILHSLPFRHKGIMTAPLIGPITIGRYLEEGQIEQVLTGGENYNGSRPCDYSWVKRLSEETAEYNVRFCFFETGSVFIKDGRRYEMPDKALQAEQALKSGLSHEGRKLRFRLTYPLGMEVPEAELYKPHFSPRCAACGSRMICNGCSRCGECKD